MKKYRQMWADPEFVRKLEEMKLKRMLGGDKKETIAKITKKMIQSPRFKDFEDELLGSRPGMGFRYE